MDRSIHHRRQTDLSNEVVVTVHGLLAGSGSMRCLGKAASELGFSVANWSYPSMRGSIIQHAAGLSRLLSDLAQSDHVQRIHFVTHSMGGVIARAAIIQSRLESKWVGKCGRIVMLAPPNAGSRLTRIPLGPFTSWFPQLRELSEAPDSFVQRLPAFRRMHVGVIAAQHDFVVAPESTHLQGELEHAIVATSHQRVTRHPEAIEMAMEFVQSSRFQAMPATIPFRFNAEAGTRKVA